MRKIVKKLIRKNFEFFQRFNLNILPKYYYSGIPDINFLKKETFWREEKKMYGVEMNSLNEQVALLEKITSVVETSLFKDNFIKNRAAKLQGEFGFGVIEPDVLFSFILFNKPQKIIQIGCGVSTAVIMHAVELMENYNPEIICIEPYPSDYLKQLEKERKISLMSTIAQKVPYNFFNTLDYGDLFFVDSTHTVIPGSEVNYIMLDILPLLKKGVWIHFHDIMFPYDYPRNLLLDMIWVQTESTLLHAFLINNKSFKVMLSLSMLHYGMTEEMKRILPNYKPQKNADGLMVEDNDHFPSSVYLKTV